MGFPWRSMILLAAGVSIRAELRMNSRCTSRG